MMKFSLLNEDLEYIISNFDFNCFKNTTIFVTGANGFLGIWLIESLLYANLNSNLSLNIYALSRSEEAFYKKYAHLKQCSELKIIEGTVTEFALSAPKLDYIIHAANLPFDNTPYWATRHLNYALNGTNKILRIAKEYAVKSVLFASSGAVYNNFLEQNTGLIKEEDYIADISSAQVYGTGKIISEQLMKDFWDTEKIPMAVARCFALAGAYLSLEKFALGNFIKNALHKQSINIAGDGQATRSYLYGSDLVVYLLTILTQVNGFQVYNVGSERAISMEALAKYIAKEYNIDIHIEGKQDFGDAPVCYVPSTAKLQEHFVLNEPLPLETIISKMYIWHKENVKSRN